MAGSSSLLALMQQSSPDPSSGNSAASTPSFAVSSAEFYSVTVSRDGGPRSDFCSTPPTPYFCTTDSTSPKNSYAAEPRLSSQIGVCGTPASIDKVARLERHFMAREVWGWFIYEFGMSGYKMILWLFSPLLILSLFAAARGNDDSLHCHSDDNNDRDSRCLRVCDSFIGGLSFVEFSNGGSYQILEILSQGSFQPAILMTGMLGLSVMLQLALLCVISPLLDYSNLQNTLLGAATIFGIVALALPINLFKPSLWWIVGIVFLLSTIASGITSTCHDQCFACLTRGIPIVERLAFERRQTNQFLRTEFKTKISLTGSSIGSFAGALCILTAYLVYRSSLRVNRALGDEFSLRFACFLAALWWALWATISYAVVKNKPGRNMPQFVLSACLVAKHLPGTLVSDWGNRRNVFLLLTICFLSSVANAILFQSGALCFSTHTFVGFVVLAQLFSIVGNGISFLIQKALCGRNKVMLLVVMLLQLLLAIHACIGFLTERNSFGLKRKWEFIGFTCIYGASLGVLRSYMRTLFVDFIPVRMAGAYFSLVSLTTQSSIFLAGVVLLMFLHFNANLRYIFVLIGGALLVAIILLVYFPTNVSECWSSNGGIDKSESLTPASMISGSVVMSSSQSSCSPYYTTKGWQAALMYPSSGESDP